MASFIEIDMRQAIKHDILSRLCFKALQQGVHPSKWNGRLRFFVVYDSLTWESCTVTDY